MFVIIRRANSGARVVPLTSRENARNIAHGQAHVAIVGIIGDLDPVCFPVSVKVGKVMRVKVGRAYGGARVVPVAAGQYSWHTSRRGGVEPEPHRCHVRLLGADMDRRAKVEVRERFAGPTYARSGEPEIAGPIVRLRRD